MTGGGREGGPVIGWPSIKDPAQSQGGGGGVVQDVQEHNLHQFDQQIYSKKVKPKMLTCV
jgi:hypothetical protein